MKDFSKVQIEQVKDFWDESPCNIHHSKEEIGTKKYFDEVEFRKYFVEPHILKFAEFERWRGKKVLEIGCGIGTDTVSFARNGARVTVVELSSKSIDIAKMRAKTYGLENKIQFYSGDAEKLSSFLPNEKFDLVYSFGVIHHTPHPENVIKEIKSFVHSKSIIKIMVYNRFSWKALWIFLKYGKGINFNFKKLIASHSEAQEDCPVTYTYTKGEIKKMLESFNFKVVDIKIEHIFPYNISDYVNYKYTKVWYFRILPDWLFKFLEKKLGWHLCVTAVPNEK
ncbi:MAG: class I SAM-dependent methyltransferase [Candidatus Melainabacteria bacterium]|nr:class I SAM-dependent methyltransferase [Candidatus Melainabacteria bacterium]